MTNYNDEGEMQGDLHNEDAGGYDTNADAHGGDFLQHPDDADQEDDVDAGDDMGGEDAEGDDDGEFLLENEHGNIGGSGQGGSGSTPEGSSSSKPPSTTTVIGKSVPAAAKQQTGGELQQRKVVINNNIVPGGMAPLGGHPTTGQGNEHTFAGGDAAGGDASGAMLEHAGGEEEDPNQYGEQELLDYDEEDDETAEYGAAAGGDGESLADMRSRIREMEEEADKLREMQTVADKRLANSTKPAVVDAAAAMTTDEKMEIDARSVYVGNVDYGATAEELEKHFHACGNVVRVTILCDKFTGYPKGFAYIEFGEKEAVDTALALDESMFRGRQIKVSSKRTNQPGISTSDRGRARGGMGGMGRGGRPMRRPFRGGFGGGPAFASRSRGGFGHGYNPYGRARPRGRRPTRFFYRGAV